MELTVFGNGLHEKVESKEELGIPLLLHDTREKARTGFGTDTDEFILGMVTCGLALSIIEGMSRTWDSQR